jgi:hypothetical protein
MCLLEVQIKLVFYFILPLAYFKSNQVNTLPKAKSQAKDKRAKDRQ